ncbi:hypothetical protein [Halococcus sp. IIIV-5B]|uniref:hypothetical protein n=1 Tax=Halococcus sp. IIIV-5B TaxID=2321230 RepID=UPI000E75643C|nr:hypothetical protein [Halococcus sp. IIIV-5B]RJS96555.1 hypothetical protein D3261_19040 [Halococcus sp. IIIV-5B]
MSFEISGVAATPGVKSTDVRTKRYPAEELRNAVGSLEDAHVTLDGDTSVQGVAGRVTSAEYEDDALRFTAEVSEKEIAKKVANDLLDVRVVGRHAQDLDHDDDGNAVVSDFQIRSLTLVPTGNGADGNRVTIPTATDEKEPPAGESAAALSSGKMPFALSADIDNMERIELAESTVAQLREVQHSEREFDETDSLDVIISTLASEAGAPSDEDIEAEQDRLRAMLGRQGDGGDSAELEDESELSEAEKEQLRIKREVFDQ